MTRSSQMKFMRVLPTATRIGVRGGTSLLSALVLVFCLPLNVAAQATVTVNTTNDLDDGSCDESHCSLREAIAASNEAAAGGIIAFNIAGSGPHTIQPSSALPPIEDALQIDGATQPGFAGAPVIELDGSLAGDAHGLDIVGSNNLIRSLAINRFAWNGISINTDCTENVIEGTYHLANTQVPVEELQAKLEAIFEGLDRKEIYLRADQAAPDEETPQQRAPFLGPHILMEAEYVSLYN